MEFYDLILKREATRSYTDKKVDREIIERVLAATRLSPSACNSQPWEYYVVDDEETLKKIAPCLQHDGHNPFCDDVPMIVIGFETPAKLMAGATVPHQYYAEMDFGSSIAYFTLAAANEGLSTCIIGYVEDENVRKILNVSDTYKAKLAITVGYSSSDKPRVKTRKSIDDVRHYAK